MKSQTDVGEIILYLSRLVPLELWWPLPVQLLIATPNTLITAYSKHVGGGGGRSGCGEEERATWEVQVWVLAVRTHLMSRPKAAHHARRQMDFLRGAEGRVY